MRGSGRGWRTRQRLVLPSLPPLAASSGAGRWIHRCSDGLDQLGSARAGRGFQGRQTASGSWSFGRTGVAAGRVGLGLLLGLGEWELAIGAARDPDALGLQQAGELALLRLAEVERLPAQAAPKAGVPDPEAPSPRQLIALLSACSSRCLSRSSPAPSSDYHPAIPRHNARHPHHPPQPQPQPTVRRGASGGAAASHGQG